MSFGDEDLNVFTCEGVSATDAAGNCAQVLLEWPEEVDFLRGQMTPGVVVGKPVMQYVTGSLVLVNGAPVIVDGVGYIVSHTWRVTDGKFSKAEIKKAGA